MPSAVFEVLKSLGASPLPTMGDEAAEMRRDTDSSPIESVGIPASLAMVPIEGQGVACQDRMEDQLETHGHLGTSPPTRVRIRA